MIIKLKKIPTKNDFFNRIGDKMRIKKCLISFFLLLLH